MRTRRVAMVAMLFLGAITTVIHTGVNGATGDISTVVGTTSVGDGGQARDATLDGPASLAADGAGNIFVADTPSHRVRMFNTTSGVMTTVAGVGAPGSTGDGGPATSARLNYPIGVAYRGNTLYITESGGHRVRKVVFPPGGGTGTISTLAGNGSYGSADSPDPTAAQFAGPDGLAVDAAGNVYVADRGNNRVRKITAAGSVTTIYGDGSTAVLDNPIGIAVDGSTLYVADSYNNRVLSMSTTGTSVTNLLTGLSGPTYLAVDSDGNLYVSDYGVMRVWKKPPAAAKTGFAGNGIVGESNDGATAATTSIGQPMGVTTSGTDVYIADSSYKRVLKVSGGILTRAAGKTLHRFGGDGGPATSAQLHEPKGAAADGAGNIYIADSSNYRIRKVSAAGVITTIAGDGLYGFFDDGTAANARLRSPSGVAVDSTGNVYFADTDNHIVRKISGDSITTVAGTGSSGDDGDLGTATASRLYRPNGVAVRDNVLFIADTFNHKIRRVVLSGAGVGTMTTVAGSGPTDGFGNGGFDGDDGPATAAKLNFPRSVAVDQAGNLFIADTNNSRVRKVVLAPGPDNGKIFTVAGNGTPGWNNDDIDATSSRLDYPRGVAVDSAGNLFIADTNNKRIRKVILASGPNNGKIFTVAGDGTTGSSGDGGPAASALLDTVESVSIDIHDNVYIVDGNSHVVRRIAGPNVATSTLPPTTTSASTPTTTPLTVPRRGGLRPLQIAAYLTMATPAGAKISLAIAGPSKKFCKMKAGRLISLKTGSCRLTVTVKPKKGKQERRSTTLPTQ